MQDRPYLAVYSGEYPDTGQPVRAGVPDPAGTSLPSGADAVRLDFADPATLGPA